MTIAVADITLTGITQCHRSNCAHAHSHSHSVVQRITLAPLSLSLASCVQLSMSSRGVLGTLSTGKFFGDGYSQTAKATVVTTEHSELVLISFELIDAALRYLILLLSLSPAALATCLMLAVASRSMCCFPLVEPPFKQLTLSLLFHAPSVFSVGILIGSMLFYWFLSVFLDASLYTRCSQPPGVPSEALARSALQPLLRFPCHLCRLQELIRSTCC